MGKYKETYIKLLESGDLFELLPEATGNWEEDKEAFIEVQDELDYYLTTANTFEEDEYLDDEEE